VAIRQTGKIEENEKIIILIKQIFKIFLYYLDSTKCLIALAKSQGGTLVTCSYVKERLTAEIYSQYARKNLDLFQQEPRGIGR